MQRQKFKILTTGALLFVEALLAHTDASQTLCVAVRTIPHQRTTLPKQRHCQHNRYEN